MCLAVPGRLVSVSGAGLLRAGKAAFGGVVREVSLAYVPDASVGDYVIVHAGVAISVLDQEEAARTLELLREVEGEHGVTAVRASGFASRPTTE